MRVLAFLRDAFGRSPRLVSLATGLLVAVGLLETIALLTVAPVVDLVVQTDTLSGLTLRISGWLRAVGIRPSMATLLILFLVVNAAKASVQSLSVYVVLRARYAVMRELMRGTFAACLGARWEFFTSRGLGRLLNMFIRDTMVVGEALGALARLAAGTIQLTIYIVVPFYISWQLTGFSMIVCVLLIWPFIALGRVSYRLGHQSVKAADELASVFQESLGAAKVVLAFATQRQALARFDRAFEADQSSVIRAQTLSRSIPPVYYPLGLTVVVLTLLIARQIGMPLSETAVVLYSLLRVFSVIGPLAAEKHTIDGFFASYERVMELREAAGRERQPTGRRPFEGFHSEVVFENVSFAHRGRPLALMDVSVRVPKGSFIALVGPSGAGKSTLVDLLIGLYAPQAGRVTIDGVPLSDFDVWSYRNRLGYVPQESTLFNVSIRDNIRWACEDATDGDIAEACRLANAADFIAELPDGYDTIVGDRGVRLSGGQVQRVALARAIVREPELLILDEATSALDSGSERLIQEAIESIAGNTTIVAIAHRLSTIANADYVYVLSHGQIVEQGAYAALQRADGAFSRMVGVQSLEGNR